MDYAGLVRGHTIDTEFSERLMSGNTTTLLATVRTVNTSRLMVTGVDVAVASILRDMSNRMEWTDS